MGAHVPQIRGKMSNHRIERTVAPGTALADVTYWWLAGFGAGQARAVAAGAACARRSF